MATKTVQPRGAGGAARKAKSSPVASRRPHTVARAQSAAVSPAALQDFIVGLPLPAACFDAAGAPVCANGAFRHLIAAKVGAWQTLGAGALDAILGVSLRAAVSRVKVMLAGVKYDGRLHALDEAGQLRVLVLNSAAPARAAGGHEGMETLAHAAHQLRSPLSSLLGFSELLMNFEFDEASRRDFIESIHSQAGRLSRLLNDLVDLAKVEAGGAAALKMTAGDLSAIARESMAGFGDAHPSANLAESWQTDLPPVECDREKVGRMLVHLLENALHCSPPDSLIRVSTLLDRGGTHLGLAVEDHGSGISAADLPRIGEKFFRAESAVAVPGNGLGLAYVRAVMQAHGGALKVKSVPGDETVMTLWFPLTRSAARAHQGRQAR